MSPATAAPATRISRRGFIAGGVLLAASSTLVGGMVLRGGPNALARLATADGPRLSIGFVEGATSLAEASGLIAVPAGTVASGDAALLGRTVRVRVQGATPAFADDVLPDVDALALDALVPSPADPARDVLPFHAWGLRRGPVPQTSSPLRFSASVEPDPTLALRLDVAPVVAAPGEERHERVAVFTSGREPGRPKLREGLFLVGVGGSTWEAPRRLPAADDPGWRDLVSVVLSVQAT